MMLLNSLRAKVPRERTDWSVHGYVPVILVKRRVDYDSQYTLARTRYL
jgi:hypothetical protein